VVLYAREESGGFFFGGGTGGTEGGTRLAADVYRFDVLNNRPVRTARFPLNVRVPDVIAVVRRPPETQTNPAPNHQKRFRFTFVRFSQRFYWNSSEANYEMCQLKGKSEVRYRISLFVTPAVLLETRAV